MSDPYEVLGVPPSATLDEIKRRYRQLAAKYHPDHGAESWIFKQIRAAYEELCANLDPNRPQAAVDHPLVLQELRTRQKTQLPLHCRTR